MTIQELTALIGNIRGAMNEQSAYMSRLRSQMQGLHKESVETLKQINETHLSFREDLENIDKCEAYNVAYEELKSEKREFDGLRGKYEKTKKAYAYNKKQLDRRTKELEEMTRRDLE